VYEGADIIDSRDVIERIEELESLEADATDDEPMLEEDAEELKRLRALAEDLEGYCSDWRHGETLIADAYFATYAEELASDIGAIDRNARWPLNHIDWNAAADELKQDYTSAEYGQTTYWARCS